MEDNRPNQDLTNQDIEFIKEKVKERPLNRRKLFKKTLLTASMAAIFGLIACVTFLVLEPVFSNLLYPEEEPQQVELKEENIEDEMRPEDMILEEETETETTTELQTVVEKVALEIGDYQKLYRNMYTVAKTFADHSMVTVTGVVSDVDWFDNTYENQGQTAGLIVADNGKELLILVDDAAISQAEELEVSFYSGRSVSASLKGKDKETGLAILSVALEDISDDKMPQAVYSAPLEAEHVAETVAELPEEKKGGSKHGRILVVEDETTIRRYLHGEFAGEYHVSECSNGQEAWDYLIQNVEKVDLVVSDVMMPVMDGITLCRKIKGSFNTNHIPVILLTAKSEDADRLEGLSTGADAYMSKPFNIDILRQTAENLLKNKRRLQGKYGVALQEEKMDKIELVSPNDQMMERVMKVINENISSPDLSVEFIADKIGISRVHFHRRLKDATGLTPRDFVRNIRLSQAAKLLAGKNFDITDVAIATGFRSVSTFSTCFKGYFGMTPTEYARKNAKTKAESEREEDEDVTEGLP